ncbi:hypothetical protein Unana1_05652 [Umbelopsis nana]
MSFPPALWRTQGHWRPPQYCHETTNHSAGFSYRQFETAAIRKLTPNINRRRPYPLYHRSASPDSLYYTQPTPSSILKKSSRHHRSAFRRPVPKSTSSSVPVAFNSSPPPLQQFSTKSSAYNDDDYIYYEQEEKEEIVPQLASDQAILDDMEAWTATMRTSCAPGMLSPPGSPLSSFDDLPSFEEDFVLFP